MISRRQFLVSTLAAGAAWPAMAQNFPGALIRIVVPAAPGGGTDILARAMSQQLQTMWGQTVIVENRSGGGGLIGTRQAIAAPGDGHTLLMAATSAIMSLAVNTPSAVRNLARSRADLAGLRAALYPGRASVGAGEERGRADRAREEKSRRAVLWLFRRGRGLASVGRAVRADGRHRDAARALSRHRAGGDRSARRPHSASVLAGADRDAAYRRRHAARHRHHRCDAFGAVPGFPDHRGVRAAEIRLARLVRPVRAGDDGSCTRRSASAAMSARCWCRTI